MTTHVTMAWRSFEISDEELEAVIEFNFRAAEYAQHRGDHSDAALHSSRARYLATFQRAEESY